MPTKTVTHGQTFCAVKEKAIQKPDRKAGEPCPHCGARLPVKGQAVRVTLDFDYNVLSTKDVPPPPIWRRTPVLIGAVLLAIFLIVTITNAVEGRFSFGGGSSSSNVAGDVVTVNGFTIVNNELLGDGSYTGSGDYTIIKSLRAYSESMNATAVAAQVSVPGIDDLCLFWYVGGHEVGDGLTRGDTVTREFSVWGSATGSGSAADDQVRALKVVPEGKAVISGTGC